MSSVFRAPLAEPLANNPPLWPLGTVFILFEVGLTIYMLTWLLNHPRVRL